MARLSRVDFELEFERIQLLPGAEEFARQGIFPGGMDRNLEYFAQWVDESPALPTFARGLLYDPQTSGGLLMSVASERAGELLAELESIGEAASPARAGRRRFGTHSGNGRSRLNGTG